LLQKGFSDKLLKAVAASSAALVVSIIIAIPLIFTISETGFFSGPSIFLFILFAAAYSKFDSKFTKMSFSKNEIKVNKGLFLFRNWRKHTLPVSSIISARVYNNSENDNEWEIVFYNSENSSFYKETIQTNQPMDPVFVKELISNRIAYYKS
ncbi:MAG: hypothetical protein ABIP51_03825, partial [Bacteroidia bacterium]